MEPETIKKILEQAKSYPGTIESLQRWQDEFEIVVVTAQPDLVKSSTYIWIGKNDIPTNEVHISYYKSDIKGFALLDDFTDNLQEFAGTGRLAVCYNQPWNQNWNGPRIHSLDEFFELVQFELNKNEKSPEPKGKIT
jgi:hypothetical protein